MEDRFDQKLRTLAHTEPYPTPAGYEDRIRVRCAELRAQRPVSRWRRWVACAAAVVLLFVALPNTCAPVAHAMEQLPLLGSVVRVVTFRDYSVEEEHSALHVQTPEIFSDAHAAGEINDNVRKYVKRLLTDFQSRQEESGEGWQSLDISYTVVTDTPDWFTLRLDVLETAASGYGYAVYYHIDKSTGTVVTLGDLFRADADWKNVLQQEVLRQMEERMTADTNVVYFPEEWEGLADDQNFYFNDAGDLVLAFNEYDVAPGSMGSPEFVIPRFVYEDILK